MLSLRLVTVFALLLLLVGCQEAEPTMYRSPALFTATYGTSTFGEITMDERNRRAHAIMKYQREGTRIVAFSRNAEEARLAMQRLIAEAPADERWIAEQVAAMQMIYTFYLAPEALTHAEREALGEHLDVLIAHNNPDGAVVARTLDRIGDAWTAEQRHEAAARTIEAISAQAAAREAYHAARASEVTDPLERIEQSVRPDAAAQLQSQRTALAEAPEALRRHLIADAAVE